MVGRCADFVNVYVNVGIQATFHRIGWRVVFFNVGMAIFAGV